MKPRALALTAGCLLLGAAAGNAAPPVSPFAEAMNAAMMRMMTGMHVTPTGDVDRDFVNMMIPHHQGAIEMAVGELQYGKNPVLQRIAKEIIVDQQQEIAAMRMAIGDPLPPSASVPTQPLTVHRP